MMKKTILLIIVLTVMLVISVGYSDSRHRTAIGEPAPPLVLSRPDTTLVLRDAPGKYVLLNFWSSTDALSRQLINRYTAWLRANPDADLDLVSVNFDSSPRMFGEIVRRDGLMPATQFHVAGDTARVVASAYGLRNAYGSLLIGPDGKIVAHNPDEVTLTQITGAMRQNSGLIKINRE